RDRRGPAPDRSARRATGPPQPEVGPSFPSRPGPRGKAVIGRETLRIAWSGIAANRLRSGLTILGMTIGVASVIVLIAVGNGSSKAVQASINSLGTNVLVVMTGGFR